MAAAGDIGEVDVVLNQNQRLDGATDRYYDVQVTMDVNSMYINFDSPLCLPRALQMRQPTTRAGTMRNLYLNIIYSSSFKCVW